MHNRVYVYYYSAASWPPGAGGLAVGPLARGGLCVGGCSTSELRTEHAVEQQQRLDHPVYARTQHGTYYFVIEDVETVRVEGEVRSVLVLREVEWAGERTPVREREVECFDRTPHPAHTHNESVTSHDWCPGVPS